MSVTESIWAMVNLTLSALAVIWLTASYAKVAFQKTNKRANLLLLGYAAFLTICFFAVSYGVYGDVKYLILEKARSLYSLLFWTAILFYYIFAYRKQPLFKRIFHSIICGIAMAFSDIISVILLTALDFIAKTDFCSLILSDERWSHWYSFLGYIPTPVIYFTFLFFFRKVLQKRRLHLTFESTKQNLILLIFPIAQAAIIATFTIIIQQHKVLTSSPLILLMVGITFFLDMISSIFLFRFIQRLQNEERLTRKLQFFEKYETLSLQFQEQAVEVSRETAKLRHDFNNQMQVFFGLVTSNAIDDAKQFAAELEENFQNPELQLQYCDNEIINVILHQTAAKCAAKQIAFPVECDLPKALPFSKLDLCSLLMNPLQRAEQLVQTVSEAERSITCRLWEENGNFCFRVQNPKGPVSVQPVPLDTAAQIANSYHGTLTLSEDTGCEVMVQIPLS